jgi:transaldolase
MKEYNLLEKLAEASPGMEIWWDASPLTFENWRRKLLAEVPAPDRVTLAGQLDRMFDAVQPEKSLVRGVTTNPAISLQTINEDEGYWKEVAFGMIAKNPGIDKESLFWLLYKEIVKRGSEMLLPLFEKSHYREGYLSGQVDPRKSYDKRAMIEQAKEIAAINPNVMVKIPGTKEGYEVLEILTAWGISTNNTLAFVMSQLMDGVKSVQRGLETAKKNNVDLTRWRSVITMMEARYGDLGGLRDFARGEGIELAEAEVRLAEMAILKKAYRLFHEGNYQSKLLSCSLRLGPTVDGNVRIWHLEEKAGGNIVLTCPPSFIADVIRFAGEDDIVFEKDRIEKDIPKEVMDKLLRVPYFARGYAEDGYTRDEYKDHPALVKTAGQFSKATDDMVEFAGKCIEDFKARS